MNQIRCPNCGGYNVIEEHSFLTLYGRKIDQYKFHSFEYKTEHYQDHINSLKRLSVVSLLIGIIIELLYFFNPYPLNFELSFFILLFGVALIIFPVILLIPILFFKLLVVIRGKITGHGEEIHRCLLCNYQWAWKPGEPLLEIEDNPRLRELGQAKLKEEQERRMWD